MKVDIQSIFELKALFKKQRGFSNSFDRLYHSPFQAPNPNISNLRLRRLDKKV